MITFQQTGNLVNAAVFGEFTLADYKEFEQQLHTLHCDGKVNLLFDWRDMLGYTVDVAWEEIKFMREHPNDFNRVAVVTDNQWLGWSAWLSNLFVDANIRVFSDYDTAKAWVIA